jgi:hypothetical protein
MLPWLRLCTGATRDHVQVFLEDHLHAGVAEARASFYIDHDQPRGSSVAAPCRSSPCCKKSRRGERYKFPDQGEHDPDAKCPLFEAAMNKWMCGDRSLVEYLQVGWGVTLTSDTTVLQPRGRRERQAQAFIAISYILGTY